MLYLEKRDIDFLYRSLKPGDRVVTRGTRFAILDQQGKELATFQSGVEAEHEPIRTLEESEQEDTRRLDSAFQERPKWAESDGGDAGGEE